MILIIAKVNVAQWFVEKIWPVVGKASDVKEFEETTKNIAVLAEGLAENSGLFFSILY